MELEALRPLSGMDVYNQRYRADPGQTFEVNDRAAEKLMAKGVARPAAPPPPIAIAPDDPPFDPAQFMPVAPKLEAKVVDTYENKAVQLATKGRGRPSQPTSCPKCGAMCGSARKARNHRCEE